MIFLACAGFISLIYRFVELGVPNITIIARGLDLLTIAVPPALPIALTVGTVFAVDRLKTQKISCIAPTRVNLCGLLDVICFDKTGTLTNSGLDVKGVRTTNSNPPIFDTECNNILNCSSIDMTKVLTCCHSLTLLNNNMVGDKLDITMFEETDWNLEDVNGDSKYGAQGIQIIVTESSEIVSNKQYQIPDYIPKQYGIIKHFDFLSELQRMSSICIDISNNSLFVTCKGAPEIIESICIKESCKFYQFVILDSYIHCGFSAR